MRPLLHRRVNLKHLTYVWFTPERLRFLTSHRSVSVHRCPPVDALGIAADEWILGCGLRLIEGNPKSMWVLSPGGLHSVNKADRWAAGALRRRTPSASGGGAKEHTRYYLNLPSHNASETAVQPVACSAPRSSWRRRRRAPGSCSRRRCCWRTGTGSPWCSGRCWTWPGRTPRPPPARGCSGGPSRCARSSCWGDGQNVHLINGHGRFGEDY